jgi:hypothetical protein
MHSRSYSETKELTFKGWLCRGVCLKRNIYSKGSTRMCVVISKLLKMLLHLFLCLQISAVPCLNFCCSFDTFKILSSFSVQTDKKLFQDVYLENLNKSFRINLQVKFFLIFYKIFFFWNYFVIVYC